VDPLLRETGSFNIRGRWPVKLSLDEIINFSDKQNLMFNRCQHQQRITQSLPVFK